VISSGGTGSMILLPGCGVFVVAKIDSPTVEFDECSA
jgi:hypothetical protein